MKKLYAVEVKNAHDNIIIAEQEETGRIGSDFVEYFLRRHGYARMSVERVTRQVKYIEAIRENQLMVRTTTIGGPTETVNYYLITLV